MNFTQTDLSSERMEIFNKNCKKLDDLSKIYPELNRIVEITYFYLPFLFSKNEEESNYWYEQLVNKLKNRK